MSEEKRPHEQVSPPREEKPDVTRDPGELEPTATWPAGASGDHATARVRSALSAFGGPDSARRPPSRGRCARVRELIGSGVVDVVVHLGRRAA